MSARPFSTASWPRARRPGSIRGHTSPTYSNGSRRASQSPSRGVAPAAVEGGPQPQRRRNSSPRRRSKPGILTVKIPRGPSFVVSPRAHATRYSESHTTTWHLRRARPEATAPGVPAVGPTQGGVHRTLSRLPFTDGLGPPLRNGHSGARQYCTTQRKQPSRTALDGTRSA